MSAPARGRRFLVAGGGCFGERLARSLLRARERGRLPGDEIWVIDRAVGCAAAALAPRPGFRVVAADWEEFFTEYLRDWARGAARREEDLLAPTPLASQLFAGWLARALASGLRITEVAPPLLPETPLVRLTGARLVLSHAEWRCPARCIEPAVCPATRQPRTWEITRALRDYARRLRAAGAAPLAGPYVGRVTHVVEGVGAFPLMDWARAARLLDSQWSDSSRAAAGYALVGTVSGCHGAAVLLRAASRDAAPLEDGVAWRACDPASRGGGATAPA